MSVLQRRAEQDGLKAVGLTADPVPRLIFAVDIEGSTERSNLARSEMRRSLYELLDQTLEATGISARHLEPSTDRGDGILVLIKPHDDVPKTLVLGRLVPILAALLAEHNDSAARPELRMRLRAVVHAGEIHEDHNGFYGDDLDAAFRLLDAPPLKKALRRDGEAPLILVVSEEIYTGVVQQGYLDESSYRPLVQVRVGRRLRRGWAHIPDPIGADQAANRRRKGQLPGGPRLSIAAVPSHRPAASEDSPQAGAARASRQVVTLTDGPPQAITLAALYQAAEQRQAETSKPFDIEAGLVSLEKWMPTDQAEPQ